MNFKNPRTTQDLIDQALQSKHERTSSRCRNDAIQYGEAKLSDGSWLVVEVYSDCVVSRREQFVDYKVKRTNFWHGSLRVTRALAEELLAS